MSSFLRAATSPCYSKVYCLVSVSFMLLSKKDVHLDHWVGTYPMGLTMVIFESGTHCVCWNRLKGEWTIYFRLKNFRQDILCLIHSIDPLSFLTKWKPSISGWWISEHDAHNKCKQINWVCRSLLLPLDISSYCWLCIIQKAKFGSVCKFSISN